MNPDRFMPELSEEDIAKLAAFLDQKGVLHHCPHCQTQTLDWEPLLAGAYLPIVCQACGFTLLYSLRVAGVDIRHTPATS